MKDIVQWENRQNASEMHARGLKVFSKWAPSEHATFKEFVGRVDETGGSAVIETDDITTIARDMAIFGAFFDMNVYPVLEIQDIAGTGGDAIDFRASA
jgi:hypothetical protein